MGARLNIEGQRFGRLVALHDVGRSKGKCKSRLWECLCDCGKFTVVATGCLRSRKTKSCGCLHSELASSRAKKLLVGPIKLPVGEGNLNNIIRDYKRKAKNRNREFSLTKEQFRKLTKQKCFYCGAEPCAILSSKKSNGKYVYNGIDRVDNEKGYTVDNCVACCGTCNRMKNIHTQQDFLAKIKLIYDHMLKGRNG